MKYDRYNGKNTSWDDPWDRRPPRDPAPQAERFSGNGSDSNTEPPPDAHQQSAENSGFGIPASRRHSVRNGIFIFFLVFAIVGVLFSGLNTVNTNIEIPTGANDGVEGPSGDSPGETPPNESNSAESSDEETSAEDGPQCYLERAETGTGVSLTAWSNNGLEELRYEDLYSQCIESVVSIVCYQSGQTGSSGTGTIIASDGYIVTNEHVIEDATECYVLLNDGSYYEASLVGMDAESDLAVLKIDADGLPAASFGDSDELVVGNGCFAIGDPLGQTFRGTMTTGIISALNRNVNVNGFLMTLIQTDCAINSGNSGGPLINLYGQVIGICNMKMISTQTTVEGLGFAIPSNTVITVVNKLIATGEVEKAMLGITASNLTPAQCQDYGIENGIVVATVSEASDAFTQGILPGDIIVFCNGEPVHSVNELNAMKGSLYPGDSITLTILRDGAYYDFSVLLMREDSVY